MCYAVKCGKCGKTTWAGCGSHVSAVYNGIPQGKHCLCNPWPGIPSMDVTATANTTTTANNKKRAG